MRKNVAGQAIGAQLLSRADGTPFVAGSPAEVFVTGDNGDQDAATQNGGLATHKGNGYWSYSPSQAETNYDHIAFTFVHADAVAVTVQVYTDFPQTGDSFARLGAPIGADIAADIATRASQSSVDDVPTNDELATALDPLATTAQLTAAVAPLATEANLNAVGGAVVAVGNAVTGVQNDTNDIQARLPAALVGGRMPADVGAVDGDATAAGNMAKATRAVARGTAAAAGSTTSIPTSAFTPAGAAADQFKGRVVTFDADTATAALRGQSTVIEASSNSATPTLTVTALTTAPAAGDAFSVT